MNPRRIVVAAAIVAHENRVLLLRRRTDDFLPGLFELPSGEVEPGEEIMDALGRELGEETGLRLARVQAELPSFTYRSQHGVTSTQRTFVVEVVETDGVSLREHDDYRWASPFEPNPGASEEVWALLQKIG